MFLKYRGGLLRWWAVRYMKVWENTTVMMKCKISKQHCCWKRSSCRWFKYVLTLSSLTLFFSNWAQEKLIYIYNFFFFSDEVYGIIGLYFWSQTSLVLFLLSYILGWYTTRDTRIIYERKKFFLQTPLLCHRYEGSGKVPVQPNN